MSFQFNNQSNLAGSGLISAAGGGFLTNDHPPTSSTDFKLFQAGLNDAPLEFNKLKSTTTKSRPLSDKDESSLSPASDKNKDPRRNLGRERKDRYDSDSSLTGDVSVQNGANLGPSNMWNGMMGMTYPMVGMNMLMDPNMISMNNYGIMPSIMAPDPGIISPDSSLLMNSVKEIIHCKSCTLFPPNPNAPPPTTRERPPGCRTVFVGGLPENMTEEIITEVFERCGEITTLRLSIKNFCHIRYVYEASVDAAIFLSGYRIRIGANTDSANTGRLHVDYAQARDDQYEWECRQRQLQREQRHRERMEEERLRPPSPPPVVHYTDHESIAISEKIKQDDTFTKAVLVVITWLERGDCNKRNSNNFYSMIQSTNSHVRRLLGEKNQYEEELKKAKEIMKGRMQGILLQFSQIERLFVAACHKKVWDHFTKAQRKNIETWKKLSMEIKNVQLDDSTLDRADDEMDVSDEDEAQISRKRHRPEIAPNMDDQRSNSDLLKDENESLRCQMEAYKNEVDVLKVDFKKEIDDKEKQFKMLQQTLQGMQQQLIEAKRKQAEEETKTFDLMKKLKQNEVSNVVDKDGIISIIDDGDISQTEVLSRESTPSSDFNQNQRLNETDAKLVGIVSTFLNVHPFGAGLDYIWSYVSKFEANIRPSDIEVLMNKFPSIFKQDLIGIGANIERRWMFNAFKSINN